MQGSVPLSVSTGHLGASLFEHLAKRKMTCCRCTEHWCLSQRILGVDVCSFFHQQFSYVVFVLRCGVMQCGSRSLILLIYINAKIKQHFTNISRPYRYCNHKWGPLF